MTYFGLFSGPPEEGVDVVYIPPGKGVLATHGLHAQRHINQAWWCVPVAPALLRQRQMDQKHKVILSYFNKFGANLDYMRPSQTSGREIRSQDGARGIRREAGLDPEEGRGRVLGVLGAGKG